MEETNKQTEIKLDIPYQETVSRLFIFRPLWVAIVMWPMMVWGFWVGLVGMVHFWYMLILGKRHQGMFGTQVRFMQFLMKWQTYLKGVVDKRPNFTSHE